MKAVQRHIGHEASNTYIYVMKHERESYTRVTNHSRQHKYSSQRNKVATVERKCFLVLTDWTISEPAFRYVLEYSFSPVRLRQKKLTD